MSRAGNSKECLRCFKMTHTVYELSDEGDFSTHEDDQFYKEKTLAEVIGVDRTRRYASKFDDKKRKRNRKETKTKGRCQNKNYLLSGNRFKKNGGRK